MAALRPGLELDGPLRWNIITKRSLSWTGSQGSQTVIPDQSILCATPVLQVGIACPAAPPHWFLGGWATPLLLVSPDSQSGFITGSALETELLPINNLRVIDIGVDDPMPYLLRVKIPGWLQSIELEVYGYDFSV